MASWTYVREVEQDNECLDERQADEHHVVERTNGVESFWCGSREDETSK